MMFISRMETMKRKKYKLCVFLRKEMGTLSHFMRLCIQLKLEIYWRFILPLSLSHKQIHIGVRTNICKHKNIRYA